MKRLTTRVHEKSSLVKGMSIFDIEEAIDHLTAIEDILGDEYDLNDLQKAMWCIQTMKLAFADDTASIERLRELWFADRDGRCFTSPVKIGQTVWFVRDPKRNPENIVETTVEKIVCKRGGTYMKLGCNSMYETSCNSIGKTVFLTRAEAQAALRREQDG